MKSGSLKKLCFIFAVIICCAFLLEQYFMFKLNPYPCEDAYITYRFSQNLAEGNGPVFNPGERVEGYSNPVWMTMISLAFISGFEMSTFSRAGGFIFNLLSFMLVWLIPIRFFGISRTSSFVAPVLYILFLPVHFHATSGLETSLYTFLILLLAYVLLSAKEKPCLYYAAGIIFLILSLTRPEGVIFFGFFCFYAVAAFIIKREPIKPILPAVILFVTGYSLFLLWRLSYFGLPLPNTYYAKGALPFFIRTGLGYLTNKAFVTQYFYMPLICILITGFVKLSVNRALVIILLLFSAGILFSIGFSGFDWMPFFRYTVPVVPLLIILCQIIISKLLESIVLRKKIVWGIVCFLMLFFAVEQFLSDTAFNFRWKQIGDYAIHNQKTFAEWYKKEIGTDPLLAIGDVGRIAFYSDARILDIFGLTSHEFAQLKKNYGFPDIDFKSLELSFDAYKEKELALLLKLKPDYVMLYNAGIKISDNYPGSAKGITDKKKFKDEYQYMTTFSIIPDHTSTAWPKPYYGIDVLDLSAGLLAWIKGGWGYDIYIRRDSSYKKFQVITGEDEKIVEINFLTTVDGQG